MIIENELSIDNEQESVVAVYPARFEIDSEENGESGKHTRESGSPQNCDLFEKHDSDCSCTTASMTTPAYEFKDLINND